MDLSAALRALTSVLIGEPELTPIEVAAAAGADIDEVRRLWRGLGFPPVPDGERVFTRFDVAMLQAARQLAESGGTPPETLLQLTRVTGQSLARLAEAQVAATAESIELRPGVQADFEAMIERTRNRVPGLEALVSYVWRRHLLAALARFSAGADGQPGDHVLAVGFADLVGFTALTRQLDERQLAATIDRFEGLAYEQIPERGGRVVKMIGDEVMFVADDAATAVEIALGLVEAAAAEDLLPDLRVGLAIGSTLAWEGDFFGTTVNLASRLVDAARPGSILVADELAEQIRDHPAFELRRVRRLVLKGFGRQRVWGVRRAGSPARGVPILRPRQLRRDRPR